METNWSENVRLRPDDASSIATPETIQELQELVAKSSRLRAVGSGHSFNEICQTASDGGRLVSLSLLSSVLDFDVDTMTVTAEGGVTYGQLSRWLAPRGLALRNMASLPHVTVAGAIATGTHGSGLSMPNLAGDVAALEFVRADGQIVRAARLEEGRAPAASLDWAGDLAVPLEAAACHLGCLGVVSQVSVDVVPAFDVRQCVLSDVPLASLLARWDDVCGAADGLSAFVDFSRGAVDVLWLREAVGPERDEETGSEIWPTLAQGAPGDAALGLDPSAPPDADDDWTSLRCMRGAPVFERLGGRLRREPVPFLESGRDVLATRRGPSYEVLPFFTEPGADGPGSGAARDAPLPNMALHAELHVPLSRAVEALERTAEVAGAWPGWGAWDADGSRCPSTAGMVVMSEIRLVRGDDLWTSPHRTGGGRGDGGDGSSTNGAAEGAFVCIHFTFGSAALHAEAVDAAVAELEAALLPLGARPHLGKLFAADGAALEKMWPDTLPRFRELCVRHDPERKFANAWTREKLGV
jgi:xylitol oxidase